MYHVLFVGHFFKLYTMTTRSSLSQAAQAVISAYNSWDITAIMGLRAPDCVNYVLPASMGLEPMNNDQYVSFLTPTMPAFQNFQLAVRNTIVDETAREVVMHLTSTASTALGEYHNEYMVTLHITEDGGKIDRFEEFVDSKYSTDYMSRLQRSLSQSDKAKM